jgi:Holliday junction resolvase-like predicted endonuclease
MFWVMEAKSWSPRRQGDIGELSAISWLMSAGAQVSMPLFHSPDYDLIADFGRKLLRVQVKTSVAWHNDRFVVALCTRGGNRSWNRVIKHLDASRCDSVFVHVGDGRRWYIPARALGGTTSVCVGGQKYSEYEVESGEPLEPRFPTLDSAPPWRDSRAVKGDAL